MTRILIVDDDPALRDVLGEVFAEEGFDVMLAQDGHEALARHGDSRADLILLDIDMPRVNGYEVLSHLRANQDPVPVIFLSGRTTPEEQRHGFRLGCNDYVGKPVPFRDLRRRVKVQLSMSGAFRGGVAESMPSFPRNAEHSTSTAWRIATHPCPSPSS